MSAKPIICVLGSVNTDYVMTLPRLPLAGETLAEGSFQVAGGGKGANQAIACARLGAEVIFLGAIGDDNAGRQSIAAFGDADIDTAHILVTSDAPTGAATIFVDADGSNMIGIAAGANACVTPALVESWTSIIANADALLLQLEVPPASVAAAIDIAAGSGTQVFLNPAPAIDLPPSALAQVDYLIPNETEAAALTATTFVDRNSAEHAGAVLQKQIAGIVITTLGADGVLVSKPDRNEHFEAKPATVVDTVAAGDTFAAGLAVALLEGATLERAINFAQRAAALTISRSGAVGAIPMRAEIQGS